jgi:trehalose 6-phosphate phosphatase
VENRISEPGWSLFLDVDGTLVDIAHSPDAVNIDATLRDLLERVRSRLEGALALVSGRPISELDRMFAPQVWPAAGVHGLERRDALGTRHFKHVIDDGLLAIARYRLQRVAERLPGTIFEDKGITVALHYRGAPQHEHLVRREARDVARDLGGDFQVLEGRKVVELRPGGATKADAVRDFLREPPYRGRRPIFIGDDVTDEEALREVERLGGLSIAVGDRVSGMVRVAGPRDVRALLQDMAEHGEPHS